MYKGQVAAEDCRLSHVFYWGIAPRSCIFVEGSTVICLLILPTVFHVLINGHGMCPNRIWSCDVFDDQTLGGSCVVFPGSHAVRSHYMLGTERLCDLSHDRSCDRFPWSHVLEIT